MLNNCLLTGNLGAELAKNCTFLNRKLISAHNKTVDEYKLEICATR
jgi:hypothetical protein